ncbi:polyprenyl synthetase family protein [Hydrogenivirga sp. 128-5-R1-1]|uniref:polyprenyl synthetase family protein n=1 Tax=Hydrogenivirga sp. 128-5-R1-1 TaxID=392423 RepID=UPI00015F16B8|nr:polyprenyl synthetase family protein [Hydrogenivirga sp. 128-5-R1-1]EDP76032.1 octoprenyl-diphosphate synthase [Hydrogenivirga sp. 128-5-R1-1]
MVLLEAIERRLLEELNPKVKLVLETGRYLIDGGGKRLRPLITMLSCGMCGGEPEDALPLGVGLEYIHAASLLHDDVVDGAKKRRGRESANLIFGNEVAVLTGDYMYAKALHLFATHGTIDMIRIVSRAVMDMAEAQVLELSRVGELITEEEYFQIIDGKTAVLFGACVSVGGLAGGCDEEGRLYEVGLRMGRAFQLIDDLLDYAGNSEKTGKPVGNDLREGKTTYPLLSVLDSLDRVRVESLLKEINPSAEEIESLRREVLSLGGDVKTKERAVEELSRAKELLSVFPENQYKEEILKLMDFVAFREL